MACYFDWLAMTYFRHHDHHVDCCFLFHAHVPPYRLYHAPFQVALKVGDVPVAVDLKKKITLLACETVFYHSNRHSVKQKAVVLVEVEVLVELVVDNLVY